MAAGHQRFGKEKFLGDHSRANEESLRWLAGFGGYIMLKKKVGGPVENFHAGRTLVPRKANACSQNFKVSIIQAAPRMPGTLAVVFGGRVNF